MTEAAVVVWAHTSFDGAGRTGRAGSDGARGGGGRQGGGERSGGLKAQGQPHGATGVPMHVISAKQLAGAAGAMPLPRADIGGVFKMGGASVANYVSILEPLRG
jgi:acetyl-CoA C-acetyltransferase